MASIGKPIFIIFCLLLPAVSAAIAVSPSSSPPSAPAPSSPASPTSTSPLDPKQLRALESLNIPTGKNPCAPPAASCDSSHPFRHIVSLTLSNCSDDIALSVTAFESLSSLTSLSFINCPVSPIRFPSELAGNLRSFTCVGSLKKLTGVWLSKLQNVTELTVSGVTINASGPSIILAGMKLLHSVTLSRCDLGGSLPRHFHQNLTSIDLSENHLTGNIPSALTRLEKLLHLNLTSNSLNDTIPPTIGDLISLQNLSLASNALSGQIPDSLASLSELTHLDLGSNQLEGTVPDFLANMKKLKHLNLERNNFHGRLPFNSTFIGRLEVFKVGDNSNLCYNRSVLGPKAKLGIAPCDRHGLPMSPPPAKDSSADDSDDGDYNSSVERKKHDGGPSKVAIAIAIVLSSVVFLVAFLVCLCKCCK